MTCYRAYDKDRNPTFFLCGDLGPHCADCADVGENLCDYPVGNDKTCDRPACQYHSRAIAPNMHYCLAHFYEWLNFRGITEDQFRAAIALGEDVNNVVFLRSPEGLAG